jgi:hypothetical protein
MRSLHTLFFYVTESSADNIEAGELIIHLFIPRLVKPTAALETKGTGKKPNVSKANNS